MFEKHRAKLREWFKKFPEKSQSLMFANSDYSMTVKHLIDLLAKAKLLETSEDRELLIKVAERYYDPEETYNVLEIIKEKEKGINVVRPDREAKLAQLAQSEMIFLEFFDTLILYLFKKNGLTMKDAEINNRINKSLGQLYKLLNEDDIETTEIKWPTSQKDEIHNAVGSKI